MPIFEKKPVRIEARQLKKDNVKELTKWCEGSMFTYTDKDSIEAIPIISIVTLEGRMTAVIDDWIIKGVSGEFYPCRDDIFKKTYLEVEE